MRNLEKRPSSEFHIVLQSWSASLYLCRFHWKKTFPKFFTQLAPHGLWRKWKLYFLDDFSIRIWEWAIFSVSLLISPQWNSWPCHKLCENVSVVTENKINSQHIVNIDAKNIDNTVLVFFLNEIYVERLRILVWTR